MRDSFGARLRQQREERGVSLNTIVEQTKIKLSLLDGLERDDISHWPSGIFRRAYIRAYAHAIGLNPDHVLREFLEAHPEPAEIIETPAPPPRARGLVGTFGSFALRRRAPAVDPPPPPAPRHESWSAPLPPPVNVPSLRPEPMTMPEAEFMEDPEPVAPSAPMPVAIGERYPEPSLDFLAAAQVCTELARVEEPGQMEPLLREVARILDAKGLIVWLWDSIGAELRPAIAHGYSTRVLAQLPALGRDADNVTAAAFRSAQTCTLGGSDETSGALAVPLLTPGGGCGGVLAIELPALAVRSTPVQAAATFFAAVLSQLVPPAADADAPAAARG